MFIDSEVQVCHIDVYVYMCIDTEVPHIEVYIQVGGCKSAGACRCRDAKVTCIYIYLYIPLKGPEEIPKLGW